MTFFCCRGASCQTYLSASGLFCLISILFSGCCRNCFACVQSILLFFPILFSLSFPNVYSFAFIPVHRLQFISLNLIIFVCFPIAICNMIAVLNHSVSQRFTSIKGLFDPLFLIFHAYFFGYIDLLISAYVFFFLGSSVIFARSH